jgi:pimeloyl-ACP methyl ester carboxylesterase
MTSATETRDDGRLHVVQDGEPGAPALLLIHGLAASTACWDLVVPSLAAAHHVIRVDLAGHGKSPGTGGGYDIPSQARRVGAALDTLGVRRVTAVGHSTGGSVATELAAQRPGTVTALALINTGPDPEAKIPDGRLLRLLLSPVPGRLLWRLRTEDTMRKAARTAFARPVEIPSSMVQDTLGMTHRAFAGTARGARAYITEQSLPSRLAELGLPLLVIFGVEDGRWYSSSAAGYRAVPGARVELLPGVGHTPIIEDPGTTATLLLDFAAAQNRI